MSSQKGVPVSSPVADVIRHVRGDLTQEQFAEKLGVERQAVLTWERGTSSSGKPAFPSSDNYVRLAKFASERGMGAVGVVFLGYAGVDDKLIRALAPEMDKAFRAHERRLKEYYESSGDEMHWRVPLVEYAELSGDFDSVVSQVFSRARGMETPGVAFPKSFVPHPIQTVCFLAPDDYMKPVFRAGDVVAVDLSFAAPQPGLKALLRGLPEGDAPMVAAYHRKVKGGESSNALRSGLHLREMTMAPDTAKRLRARLVSEVGRMVSFTPSLFAALGVPPDAAVWPWTEQEQLESRTADITDDPSWSILGRIVAWVGSDPIARKDPRFRKHAMRAWAKAAPKGSGPEK